MATPFSHAFAAVALGKAIVPRGYSWRFWVLAAGSAALPDADVLGFGVGIPYESMWGHRGFSHSLCFAAAWAVLVVLWEFKTVIRFSQEWWGLFAFFFAVTASHGVLDAFTNGGLGVGFFIPFDSTRYFFPWTPIEVSPISIRQFFTAEGWDIIRNEFRFIWVPFGILWILGAGIRWLRVKRLAR